MRKYFLFFLAVVLLSSFKSSAAEQTWDCIEIGVDPKVIPGTNLNDNKVILNFSLGLDFKDFKLFLFAKKKSGNRLDFTSSEIDGLSSGIYILIIQSKEEGKFCTKQIELKIK